MALVIATFPTWGCGGSDARLLELRCAGDCQDVADPFLLTLEIEVKDPAEVLRGGELELRIDDRERPRQPLGPLIVGASRIAFELTLPTDLLSHGRTFTVAARAWDGLGRPTNEVTLELVIQL